MSDEATQCPACAEAPLVPWRSADASDLELAARPSYLLGRCPACGTAAIIGDQLPHESSRNYSTGTYGAPPPSLDRVLGPPRRLFLRERLRSLRNVASPSRVFEVGAGDGSFVALLRERGYDARGIDPAAPPGSAVERRSAEELDLEPGSQDVVVLWHALEHVSDPAAVIARVHDALAPGGLLVVGVPNLDGLQAKLGGDRWFHQDVPRHRVHFTHRGLVRLLERSGFRIRRTRHFVAEQGPFGMWQTALNLVTPRPNVFFRAIKGLAPERSRDLVLSILAVPLFPAALAAEAIAAGVGRGGAVTVEALKRA